MPDRSSVSDPYCIVTASGTVTPDKRQAMIKEAAYYRAARRGFAPGHELEDWLLAEQEIDATHGAGARRQ